MTHYTTTPSPIKARPVSSQTSMVSNEAEQRILAVEEAKSWLGTKFRYGAALKGVGVACGPFLFLVHKNAWLNLPYDLPLLARDWHFHTKEEKFLEQIKRFTHSVEFPLPGDVAMFRLGAKDRPYSHGAIVVDWPHSVIHAHFHLGVIQSDVTTEVLLATASEVSFWSPWQ